MKDKLKILLTDKYLASFFSIENQTTNSFLNQLTIDKIAYAYSLQNNIFEIFRLKIDSNLTLKHRLKNSLRIFGLDHLIKFFIGIFRFTYWTKTPINTGEIIYFTEIFVPHILDDFKKIINHLPPSQVRIVTNDTRVVCYMNKHVSSHFVSIHQCSLINLYKSLTLYYTLLTGFNKISVNYKNSLNKEFLEDFKNIKKLYWIYLLSLSFYSILLRKNFEKIKPRKIIFATDGLPLSRLLIDICKDLNIETIVIQHGLITSFNGYLPIFADKIFVFSAIEKKFLIDFGVLSERIVVTGSLKTNAAEFSKLKKTENEKLRILFVLSTGFAHEIDYYLKEIFTLSKMLDFLEHDLVIRPHPFFLDVYINVIKNSNLPSSYRLDKESLLSSLLQADIIIVSAFSTVLLDATAIGKKEIFVLDSKNNIDIAGKIYESYYKQSNIPDIFKYIKNNKKDCQENLITETDDIGLKIAKILCS